MEKLSAHLESLPNRHQAALAWFFEKAGTDQPWPTPLSDGTFLVTKAKGIYKPNWTQYSLSVRQTLNGPYHDLDPVMRSDGTWAYSYFQENNNPEDRDASYANRALVACWHDGVPVGVMRQVSIEPQVRYHIFGLALVSNWEGGYFFLEGFSNAGYSVGRGSKAETEMLLAENEVSSTSTEIFHPENILDGRKRIISSIVQRQGQSEFRRKLLDAYNGLCAITEYNAVEVLEAAHIIPYRGPQTNHPSNGLLLRADLHTLFDLGLIAIDTKSMVVITSSTLRGTAYQTFAGKILHLPTNESVCPSKEALDEHRTWTGL